MEISIGCGYVSVVGIVTRLQVGQAMKRSSIRDTDKRIDSETSRLALEPAQIPIKWVSRVISPEVNRPKREAYHTSPSDVEIKNEWRYVYTPVYTFVVFMEL